MPQPNDPRALRDAFGAFMTGVTVVTALDAQGQPIGFTANSFTSVSLEPPLLLVCLARSSRNFDAFTQGAGFAINVLAEHQKDISNRFAKPMQDRFAEARMAARPAWRAGDRGGGGVVRLFAGTGGRSRRPRDPVGPRAGLRPQRRQRAGLCARQLLHPAPGRGSHAHRQRAAAGARGGDRHARRPGAAVRGCRRPAAPAAVRHPAGRGRHAGQPPARGHRAAGVGRLRLCGLRSRPGAAHRLSLQAGQRHLHAWRVLRASRSRWHASAMRTCAASCSSTSARARCCRSCRRDRPANQPTSRRRARIRPRRAPSHRRPPGLRCSASSQAPGRRVWRKPPARAGCTPAPAAGW